MDINGQNFKPTEEMLKVLEAFADMEVKPSVSARMEIAGVRRQSWYDWIKLDGFLDWWDKETNRIIQAHIGELRKIGIMKSVSDFRFWEAMMMKYDKFVRKEDVGENTLDALKGLIQAISTNGQSTKDNNGGDTGNNPQSGE